MKRATLHESIRRGIAIYLERRSGRSGEDLIAHVEIGVKTRLVHAMADEIIATIEVEHPGAIEP